MSKLRDRKRREREQGLRFVIKMTDREYRALVSMCMHYVVECAKNTEAELPEVFILASDQNDEQTSASDVLLLVTQRAELL